LIGFGRPTVPTARDETRLPDDRRPRSLGQASDPLVKAGFRVKLHFKFHLLPFRFPLPPVATLRVSASGNESLARCRQDASANGRRALPPPGAGRTGPNIFG